MIQIGGGVDGDRPGAAPRAMRARPLGVTRETVAASSELSPTGTDPAGVATRRDEDRAGRTAGERSAGRRFAPCGLGDRAVAPEGIAPAFSA